MTAPYSKNRQNIARSTKARERLGTQNPSTSPGSCPRRCLAIQWARTQPNGAHPQGHQGPRRQLDISANSVRQIRFVEPHFASQKVVGTFGWGAGLVRGTVFSYTHIQRWIRRFLKSHYRRRKPLACLVPIMVRVGFSIVNIMSFMRNGGAGRPVKSAAPPTRPPATARSPKRVTPPLIR